MHGALNRLTDARRCPGPAPGPLASPHLQRQNVTAQGQFLLLKSEGLLILSRTRRARAGRDAVSCIQFDQSLAYIPRISDQEVAPEALHADSERHI
jgi:hypothetical protein